MKISSYMNNMNPIIEKNDAKVQKENKQAMQGLILLCMTLLLHIPAAGGVRLNMENGFLLRLTLPFPVKKSVITIPVSAVSLPGSLAIRKFWLMSQQQKKSMVKNACFQYDFSRRTADFLCMAGKSTIESDRQ